MLLLLQPLDSVRQIQFQLLRRVSVLVRKPHRRLQRSDLVQQHQHKMHLVQPHHRKMHLVQQHQRKMHSVVFKRIRHHRHLEVDSVLRRPDLVRSEQVDSVGSIQPIRPHRLRCLAVSV